MAMGRRTMYALTFLIIPSYFKFVIGSNSLSGFAVLVLTCISLVRKKITVKTLRGSHLIEPSNSKITVNVHSELKEGADSFNNTDTITAKCLSYNMFMRPPFIKNNKSDFKEVRLAAFIDLLKQSDIDVFALQEIFDLANGRQRRLLKAAKELGYQYYTSSVTPQWYWSDMFFPVTRSSRRPKLIDAGLLIISRFPIVETDAHIFSEGNQIDAWAAKQVIYAKIQFGPQQFCHVFNTHMQASYFDNHPDVNLLNDRARHLQVIEMGQFISKKTAGSPYPSLITGDFNINSKVDSPTNIINVKIYDHPSYLSHMKIENVNTIQTDIECTDLEEYRFLMQVLDPHNTKDTGLRDLLFENHQHHPITYGDTSRSNLESQDILPRETTLTHTADHGSSLSIDYIFYADTTQNQLVNGISIVEGCTKVEEFFVDGKAYGSEDVTQLSDHYGISTVLRINRAVDMNVNLSNSESVVDA
eukprot:TRINITY_DN649_c0_g1_i2.p1 TRINITY_DN649_c0_g1~~TRINITY_DN649_c0_g1_i2.p1  ORF type:complete len:472 (-),score=50.47 TRINITY_DN649_c0_g1_i2:52-1467(-)